MGSKVSHPDISEYYKDILEMADAYRMRNLINPTKQAQKIREKAVRKKHGKIEFRSTNFAGTLQEIDIKKRTEMPLDAITNTHPYRFKIDTKEFDPKERVKKARDESLPKHVRGEYSEPFDFNDIKGIFKSLGLKYNFDMPLISLRRTDRPLKDIRHFDMALITQLQGCNLHDFGPGGGCIFCYVDAESNCPYTPNRGVWLGVENILTTVKELRDDPTIRAGLELHRVRLSGGEPTVMLDFALELAETIEKEKIDQLHVWFDTNLSAKTFIDNMIKENKYPKDILQQLASHDVCVYAAFKGTTDKNIIHNAQAELSTNEQMEALGQLVDARLEAYPCIYNPDYKSFPDFIDKLNENFTNASKILRIEGINWTYEPTKLRIRKIAEAINVPEEYLYNAYVQEEALNYNKCEEFMLHYVGDKYGLPYKEFDRTQFKVERRIVEA
ncbi:MAG: hypothetical protein ACE5J7_03335 [Candidatus Aenigmatarchaeota archaeon]